MVKQIPEPPLRHRISVYRATVRISGFKSVERTVWFSVFQWTLLFVRARAHVCVEGGGFSGSGSVVRC